MSVNRNHVAEAAQVSASTVSRALSGSTLIPEKTRERISRIANRLGYVPNKQAGLLSKRHTKRLGFVIPSYKNIPPFSRAYFPALLDGAVPAAEECGFSLTIVLDKVDEKAKDLVRFVRSAEVDGLVLAIAKIGDPRVQILKKQSIPFVLINSPTPGCLGVDADPSQGTKKALRHLAELGHSRIGYISGDENYINAADRLRYCLESARQMELKVVVEKGDFSRTSGYKTAAALLSGRHPPTAIFTSSDRAALGVLDYCREKSIRVPEDLSLIGYDDLDPATWMSPPLTTVHNPVSLAAAEAVKMLVENIKARTGEIFTRYLETDLVVRGSTAVPYQDYHNERIS